MSLDQNILESVIVDQQYKITIDALPGTAVNYS